MLTNPSCLEMTDGKLDSFYLCGACPPRVGLPGIGRYRDRNTEPELTGELFFGNDNAEEEYFDEDMLELFETLQTQRLKRRACGLSTFSFNEDDLAFE